jgi:hypothetical protein
MLAVGYLCESRGLISYAYRSMSKMHKAWDGNWAILSLFGITFGALALAGFLYLGPASNAQVVRVKPRVWWRVG